MAERASKVESRAPRPARFAGRERCFARGGVFHDARDLGCFQRFVLQYICSQATVSLRNKPAA